MFKINDHYHHFYNSAASAAAGPISGALVNAAGHVSDAIAEQFRMRKKDHL